MWPFRKADPGAEILDFVYQKLQIDDEWSVRESRSFTWWAHQLAQRIWIDGPVSEFGGQYYRIHAETEVVCDVSVTDRLHEALAAMNANVTMSALVCDEATGRVVFHCSANFRRENRQAIAQAFFQAAAIQAATAAAQAEPLAQILGGRVADSAHPTSGARWQPDDLLSIREAVYLRVSEGLVSAPVGDFGRAFAADVRAILETNPRPPGVLANGDAGGLTIEYQCVNDLTGAEAIFGPRRGIPGTALFQAFPDASHPELGRGVLTTLRVPIGIETELQNKARAAQRLNAAEIAEPMDFHFLGSWCQHPSIGALSFVSFIPASVYWPGLLGALVWHLAARARWVGDRLA
ncbi:MAG: hypothetical protein HY329_05375 [Chloroflexi bacterium]|nr:hypothetical protein [Chloroflexota bacterium]